ncbi:MAG TPA: multicopper oxidase family protein [Vicinamibacterales bacterium]|nr:multicopper oxidase family protein [Vicinamibacterales bacterium]
MKQVDLQSLGIGRPVSARAVVALVVALLVLPGSRGRTPFQSAAIPAQTPYADSFASPPVLRNTSDKPGVVELDLTAAPTKLELLPGKATTAWAYNGSVPGPTIELREGDSVTIHFHNKLSQTTTVHWHGLHIPAGADGSPLNPVQPNGDFTYTFKVPMGTAGTYWYHPHPDMTTTEQVARGLYGAMIVRPAVDPLAGIPDRLLVLSDNRFNPDGSVDFPEHMSQAAHDDEENGREGNVLFVNGQVLPVLAIRPGEVQRWRIINASAARIYKLALAGHKMTHVGSDGGLFEKPQQVDDLLVANSERVEVLVRGGAPGSRIVMQTLPYDRYDPHTRPKDWNRPLDLLTLQTTTDPPVAAPAIPASLRAVAPINVKQAAARRTIAFSQGLINGKAMDMKRVDITSRLNTTEIWQIQNVVGMDHPFHLHGFRFQVIDRDGVAEPYPSWKDSVNVPKHSQVRVAIRFDDFPGKWMFHCHILNHEDMGMMGILLVR